MAFGPSSKVAFRPSAGAVAYRFRVRPANTPALKDDPYIDQPTKAPDTDGKVRFPVSAIGAPADFEGNLDIHVTALDAADNESPFLEIDNNPFDFVPPAAPTEGAVEA